jgi:uncharacterized protein YdeI (YjbR/CyaY-like superfamily)
VRDESSVEQALREALAGSKPALKAFESMPPSHRKEWVKFISDAKRPETRARRIEDVVRQLTQR